MTLPNAYKGVKKIFTAEILQIISTLLLMISLVSFGTAVAAYNVSGGQADVAAGGLAIGSILMLIGVALPILALVLILVGLKQASVDEPDRMGKAFSFSIATLVLTVLVCLFQALNWGGAVFFDVLAQICELCALIFTIMGVSEVTQNISRQDVADMGPKIIVISVIAIVAAIIAGIIGNVIGGVAALISLVCLLVAYLVFLVFLARATSALANG